MRGSNMCSQNSSLCSSCPSAATIIILMDVFRDEVRTHLNFCQSKRYQDVQRMTDHIMDVTVKLRLKDTPRRCYCDGGG
jgi:hypothetical protein